MLMILLVLIEIPVLLLLIVITNTAVAIKETATTKRCSSSHSQEKKKPQGLSDEQREKIIKAILEDSLLENDSAWDTLQYEGESIYPAADAAKLTVQEFDLQYGTKPWLKAWSKALSRFFDCQTEYAGSGYFRIYGKEA